MTTLIWDEVGEKLYEGGIDRGVLYVKYIGYPWNGLLSVEDVNTDEMTPLHIDGFKIRNVFSIGDQSATLKAYTYPDEFLPCDGLQRYEGMYVDGQPPQEFSLSYRTRVGNDTDGSTHGYKIHLLYNLTAVADTKTYNTLSSSPEPVEFSWSVSGRPEEAVGYRPASHFIIDSRLWDPEKLKAFEDILYGTSISPPMIPPFNKLIEILNPETELLIIDHTNGEWTAIDLNNNNLSSYSDELFELDSPTVVMVDPDTFDVSTYTI